VTTSYLVDDLNPTGYAQVVEELAGGVVSRQYTYGLQRINENQVIDNVWMASFYGYDGGGNVRQLTNSAGAVTDQFEYDAFGNSFAKVGTTPNNYLYRAEQYDSDLGLYYLRARYYNPLTGRFMSRDPEEGEPTDPQSLHKYLYANGDPVNGIDPRGRAAAIETIFTITVIATPTELFIAGAGDAFAIWLESGPVGYATARIPDLIRWIYASQSLRWVFKQVACLVIAGAAEAALSHIPGMEEMRHWEAEKFALITAIDRVCVEKL
jgi:RHS repeat-associated protein